MRVGDRDDRQLVDAEPVEAAVDRDRLGADVDEHRRPVARGDDRRVALSDVARHHHPAVRWPTHLRRPPHAEADAERDADDHRRVPGEPPHHHEHERDEDDQQPPRRPPRERGAGQRGREVADREDHADAPPRNGARDPRDRCADQVEEPAGEARHRRGRHQRSGQDVREDRHQRHFARDGRDRRRAGELGGDRDGDGERAPPRHPALQPPRERRRGQQDPGRRTHRQHESEGARQPRVDEQQRHDRHRQRPEAASAAEAERGEADDTHRGRPDHARVGSGQQHESRHGHQAEHDEGATRRAQRPCQQQHHRQDDREVRARDGEQVGETAAPELLLHFVGDALVVAVDERRDESRLVASGVGDRVPHARPHTLRGLPPPRRRTGRRTTHDVDRRHLAGGVGRGEPADHGESPADDEVVGRAVDERGGQVAGGDGACLWRWRAALGRRRRRRRGRTVRRPEHHDSPRRRASPAGAAGPCRPAASAASARDATHRTRPPPPRRPRRGRTIEPVAARPPCRRPAPPRPRRAAPGRSCHPPRRRRRPT